MKSKIIIGLLVVIILLGGGFFVYTCVFQSSTPTVKSVVKTQEAQKSDVQLLQSYLGMEQLLDSNVQYNYTLSGNSKDPEGQVITVGKPTNNGNTVGGTFVVSSTGIYLNEDVYTPKYVKIATVDGNAIGPIGSFPQSINQGNGYFL